MSSGKILSVVKLDTGWNVVVCRRTLVGWFAGDGCYVEGTTFSELFARLITRWNGISRLAIGLSRPDFLVRVGTGSADNQFPDADTLLFWQRPVEQDGHSLVETVAMRKEEVDSILILAKKAGFTEVFIHPSWFGIASGWPHRRTGEKLYVNDGMIMRTKRGWSPWIRLSSPVSDSFMSYPHLNLGGLLLMLSSSVPRGWVKTERSPNIMGPIRVMVLIIVCLLGWYLSGAVAYNRAIGNERAKRSSLVSESLAIAEGCTIDDLMSFFKDLDSRDDSIIHCTSFRYAEHEDVELRGHARSVRAARAFVERFQPDRFSITQTDEKASFSVWRRLLCDR